jgi:hypothetical protein
MLHANLWIDQVTKTIEQRERVVVQIALREGMEALS